MDGVVDVEGVGERDNVRNVRLVQRLHLDEDLLALLLAAAQLDDFHRKAPVGRPVAHELDDAARALAEHAHHLKLGERETVALRAAAVARVLHLAHGHLLTRGRLRGTVGELVDAKTGEADGYAAVPKRVVRHDERALRSRREAIVPGRIDGERDLFLASAAGRRQAVL